MKKKQQVSLAGPTTFSYFKRGRWSPHIQLISVAQNLPKLGSLGTAHTDHCLAFDPRDADRIGKLDKARNSGEHMKFQILFSEGTRVEFGGYIQEVSELSLGVGRLACYTVSIFIGGAPELFLSKKFAKSGKRTHQRGRS